MTILRPALKQSFENIVVKEEIAYGHNYFLLSKRF